MTEHLRDRDPQRSARVREGGENMTEFMPDLTIEPLEPESPMGTQVLTQGLDRNCVHLHPLHVRHLAERTGLLDPETFVKAQALAAARSQRRLMVIEAKLRSIVSRLEGMSAATPGLEGIQMAMQATADLAADFCADLTSGAPVILGSPVEGAAAPVPLARSD